MNTQSQTEVSNIRGDGALSSFLGGYDEKINKLAEEAAQGFSAVESGIQEGVGEIRSAKDALLEGQRRATDALAMQMLAVKRAVEDLSAVRGFERENPIMLEVIQSLCALPRNAEAYSANGATVKRALNLIEDLEASLERTGLTLDRDLSGGAARFARIYKPEVPEPAVVTPCVMRGGVVVRKGTAIFPESDRPSAEEPRGQRTFEAIDVDSVV